MISMSVTPSVSFRDSAGRFAAFSTATPIQAGLVSFGQGLSYRLANATPVRSGRMRSSYRSTYAPSQNKLTISNTAPYAAFVVYGTSRMPANPAIQAVLADLPNEGQATGGGILGDFRVALMGG